eukprot:954314-Rhodomonas_salina.2
MPRVCSCRELEGDGAAAAESVPEARMMRASAVEHESFMAELIQVRLPPAFISHPDSHSSDLPLDSHISELHQTGTSCAACGKWWLAASRRFCFCSRRLHHGTARLGTYTLGPRLLNDSTRVVLYGRRDACPRPCAKDCGLRFDEREGVKEGGRESAREAGRGGGR